MDAFALYPEALADMGEINVVIEGAWQEEENMAGTLFCRYRAKERPLPLIPVVDLDWEVASLSSDGHVRRRAVSPRAFVLRRSPALCDLYI